ncbi:MAG: aryl-sulfate sulfotransferase [Anaeromyxobacteraceae bacterium]
MLPARRPLPALLTLLLLAACDNPARPRVEEAAAATLPRTVLGRRVEVRAPAAERVHVEWTEGGAARRTPDVAVVGDRAGVTVLGLAADAEHEVTVVAEGRGGTARRALRFRTDPLPPAVARLSLAVTGQPPGEWVLLDALRLDSPGVLAAFDGAGTLRWYREFEGDAPVVEAKPLADGHVIAYLGRSNGWQAVEGGYVEVDAAGEEVRRFGAAAPLFTDGHEALVTDPGTPAERLHVIGYDHREVDLAPLGLGRAEMAMHAVQRLRPDRTPEFTWNGWDHVGVDELVNPIFPDMVEGTDVDHANSIALDEAGDYVVSFRNLDAVWLLDRETGEVRWRLGGARSDFTFLDDPLGGFSGQHTATLLPGGRLLVFDNGTHHDPPTTRAVEYALDVPARTARRVWEFRHPGGHFNQFTGSAYRQPDGSTWVGMSEVGIVSRVEPSGAIAWEGTLLLDGAPTAVYRAVPMAPRWGVP